VAKKPPTQFEELASKLAQVPKKELDQQARKYRRAKKKPKK